MHRKDFFEPHDNCFKAICLMKKSKILVKKCILSIVGTLLESKNLCYNEKQFRG